MSMTQANADLVTAPSHRFAEQHPQLAPAVVAVALFVAALFVALAFTGLPA